MIGLSRSTPADLNAASMCWRDARRPFSRTFWNGTLKESGIWPERNPGRGSGAVPAKRSAERASRSARYDQSAPCARRRASRLGRYPFRRETVWAAASSRRFRPAGLRLSISAGRHRGQKRSWRRKDETSTTPRRRIKAQAVVDHDGVAVAYSERADRFAELGRARQHVRQIGRMIAHRLDIEDTAPGM